MERIKKTTKQPVLRQLLYLGAAAVVAFFLAGVVFENRVAPFGAAFAAGAPFPALIPACMGAAAGAFVFCEPLVTLENVGAVTLIFLFRIAARRVFPDVKDRFALPVIGFLSVLICGGVVSFVSMPSAESLLLSLCEGAIAGAGAAFWNRVFVLLPGGKRLLAGGAGDTAAFLFAGAMLLLSFARFSVAGVSPARIAALFCVMLLGLSAGEGAGAVGGICAGLVLGFSPERAHLVFSLPAAGLLCGIAAPAGKFAVDAAFTVCDLLFLMLRGAPAEVPTALLETATAAVLFALLPRRAITYAEQTLSPFSGAEAGKENGRLLGLRMRRASRALQEIASAVEAVGRVFRKAEAPSAETVTGAVKAAVCADCPKRVFCWERTRVLTGRDFAAAAETLSANGRLIPELLPERLAAVCTAPNALCDAFTFQQSLCAARAAVRTEVYDAKAAAARQFSQVASLLEDAAHDAETRSPADPFLAAQAETLFRDAGFSFSSVLAGADADGRNTLELLCPKLPKEPDFDALLAALYLKTNVRFMPPVQETYPAFGTLLTFCEKTNLKAEFCKVSAAGAGETLCGDACEGFADGRGGFYCVLSDGMGTGPEAAVEAAMTCSLMGRLLRARFSMSAAFGAVNAALMVNAVEETLATLDVFRLDLYSGDAHFYKAGASFSAVYVGGKTAVVEKSSLPLGILGETRFEHTEVSLGAGDKVLLMSDGADLLPKQYFKDLFFRNRNADAKTLAAAVLAEARKRAPVGRADDITVACVAVR